MAVWPTTIQRGYSSVDAFLSSSKTQCSLVFIWLLVHLHVYIALFSVTGTVVNYLLISCCVFFAVMPRNACNTLHTGISITTSRLLATRVSVNSSTVLSNLSEMNKSQMPRPIPTFIFTTTRWIRTLWVEFDFWVADRHSATDYNVNYLKICRYLNTGDLNACVFVGIHMAADCESVDAENVWGLAQWRAVIKTQSYYRSYGFCKYAHISCTNWQLFEFVKYLVLCLW